MSEQTPDYEAFIEQVLADFADYWVEQAKARLSNRNINLDEELLKSLAAKAARQTLSISFLDHGRMHDGGFGRGYHKGKFMGAEDRGEFLKGRKPSAWYSRLTWGSIHGTLVENLSNMYIAEVPKDLVSTFNKG